MEIWKTIPDYEDYQASNLGRIKSLKLGKEKIKKPAKSNHGYLSINLYKNKTVKNFKVHQLVAIAFLNHVPNGHKIVVDHINNLKTDNRLENLQLISQRENSLKDRKTTSKYRGVYWHKNAKKWICQIYFNKKSKNLGYFKNPKIAHAVYLSVLEKI